MFRDFIEISLTTSVVILLLALLSPLLSKRYAAKWRHIAWLAIALRLLFPMHFTLPEAPVRLPVFTDVTLLSFTAENPMPEQSSPAEIEITSKDIIPGSSPATVTKVIWATGAALFLLWHFAAYLLFRRRIRPWCTPYMQGKPPVMRCKAINTPMQIGFVRPVILIPDRPYNEEELQIVLTHERAHYRRKDVWYKLLLVIVNALHWFNPAVYLMTHLANRDLELACDDIVVHNQDMAFRKLYSATILQVGHHKDSVSLSTCFQGTKKDMKKRFSNILHTGKRKVGILFVSVVLVVSILLAACVTWNDEPYLYEDKALGFSLEIPAEWEGKYGIEKNGESISFYHLQIREKYQNGMGNLFTIQRMEGNLNEEDIESPSGCRVIAQANGFTYALFIPSDVQYPVWENSNAENLSAEYISMEKQVSEIADSAKTFTPDGTAPESDLTRLYAMRNTDISEARPIMEMAKRVGLPVNSIDFFDDTQSITINYKVEMRSDYRFFSYQNFEKTMAVIFALVPNAKEIRMLVFDDYGDKNIPDTSFMGVYCHRDLMWERSGMEEFTADMIADAAKTPESFTTYMEKVENLKSLSPYYPDGNAQATARYSQLTREEEFIGNSLLTQKVTVTAKMTFEETLLELLPETAFLQNYIDKELDFQTFVVRNFTNGDTHSRIFVFDGNHLVMSGVLKNGDRDAVLLFQRLKAWEV